MPEHQISDRIALVKDAVAPVIRFFEASPWARRIGDPTVSDFVFGNPQEMPLPGFVEALGRHVIPQNKDWFAYKNSEPASCAVIAATLRERRGLPFEDNDILLT